jgi:hypothetical protein
LFRAATGRLAVSRAAIAAGLLTIVVTVPRFATPDYTMEPFYTDHEQHEYSSWMFLHIGPKIFALAKTDWPDVHAAHVHLLWTSVPTIYPPGLVAFFMPFGIASNEGVISDLHVHMLMIIALGMAGVFASVQLSRTLRLSHEPVLAGILTVFGATLFIHWGLNGFIDSLAAGLALTGLYWMQRNLPGRALLAFTVGLSLQYRLWWLWPLVIALAWEKRSEIRRWQFVTAASIGLASLFAFALSLPFEIYFRDTPGINPNPLSVAHGVNMVQGIAVAGGVIVLAVAVYYERGAVAACVGLALALVFFVDQWEQWYAVVLFPLLAVVRTRPAQIAVTVLLLQVTLSLGGFPNVLEAVRLYVSAVR